MSKNADMESSQVLSFDLDDTLWPVAPVIAAAELKLHEWLSERHPEAMAGHSVESLRSMRAKVTERFPQHGHDLTFLRHRALKDLFLAAGHAESHADEALEVFFAERNRVTFYDDVQPALERLARKYRLFALSNGNADLARCGLSQLFSGHITARSAGAAKPDARIFAQLAQAAGVDAARIIHVGDDPLADVVGAVRAGMQAVWINRNASEWPAAHAPPPRTVTSLAQLD